MMLASNFHYRTSEQNHILRRFIDICSCKLPPLISETAAPIPRFPSTLNANDHTSFYRRSKRTPLSVAHLLRRADVVVNQKVIKGVDTRSTGAELSLSAPVYKIANRKVMILLKQHHQRRKPKPGQHPQHQEGWQQRYKRQRQQQQRSRRGRNRLGGQQTGSL